MVSSSHKWRRQWHSTPELLPGKFHGWRSLVAAVHGVATFHFHALEKEMATHSTVLAWRIPGMGEPGGLPSVGSHRAGHDLAAAAAVLNEGFPCSSGGKESACSAVDLG